MIRDLLERQGSELMRDMGNKATSTRADWLGQILKASDKWRPQGYRGACERLGDYYQGAQQEGLIEQLQQQFPETWRRIPRDMMLPVLRRWIDQRRRRMRSVRSGHPRLRQRVVLQRVREQRIQRAPGPEPVFGVRPEL